MPEPAVHDPGRRGRRQAAADPLQPGAPTPQPRPPDRPQTGPRTAAGLGDAAAGAAARRAGRAAVGPGRGLHPDRSRLATRACGGARRSAWSTTTCIRARSMSSGSCGRLGAPSTGCRPRTTPTAARAGNRACPSTCRRSWTSCSPARSQAQPRQRCACAGQHDGSGRYVFLGPDNGHYRRSNYARRVFRPACDGTQGPAQPRPASHRRRHNLARPPRRHVAVAQPGVPDTRRHEDGASSIPVRDAARLLAADQARPDPSRAQAQPQDVDGRGWHPGDPRRAAPGPRGARHARPVRSRVRPDARRAQGRPSDTMGGLATYPRGDQPLARPAARQTLAVCERARATDPTDHPTRSSTQRYGEAGRR